MSFMRRIIPNCLIPFSSVADRVSLDKKQLELNLTVARVDDVLPKGEGAVLRWLADYAEKADVIGLDGQVDTVRQKLIDAGYERGVETNPDNAYAVARNGIAGAIVQMASGYAPHPPVIKDGFLTRYDALRDATLQQPKPHA